VIDAHTHLDVRSFEDLEKMALCGIEKIITCAHDPYRMSTPEVYFDHWDRLIKMETKRGSLAGIDVKVALGVHPMGYPKEWPTLIKNLPKYLDNENVVAIGETGLHYLNEDEKDLLREQLYVAIDYNMPIVIHTPEKNKREALVEILKILKEVNIREDLVMIDHINKDTIDLVMDIDVYVGLTVHPMKISPMEALEIIKNHNKRFILSSDLGSLKSDIYALPKTKLLMKNNNIRDDKIRDILYKNPKEFYRL